MNFAKGQKFCEDMGFNVSLPQPKDYFDFIHRSDRAIVTLCVSMSICSIKYEKFSKYKQAEKEEDIIWQIASPLVGSYDSKEFESFIWMGIQNKDPDNDEWKTLGNKDVKDRVSENWVGENHPEIHDWIGPSADNNNLNREQAGILMGRWKRTQAQDSKQSNLVTITPLSSFC